jgi:hypothetical protein
MQIDPRSAYKAVRFAVYRKLFGGQVNILSPRNKGKGRLYEPPRKLQPKQRGGNRRTRGDRTTELMSYFGKDRGFVLRFLNAGTRVRYNGGRNGRTEEQYNTFIAHHEGRGHRGAISARNWFGGASQQQLENAASNLDKMINEYKEKKNINPTVTTSIPKDAEELLSILNEYKENNKPEDSRYALTIENERVALPTYQKTSGNPVKRFFKKVRSVFSKK